MTESKPDGGVARNLNRPSGLPRWVSAVAPILILGLLVGGFLLATPLAGLESGGEALPAVSIDYTTLPDDETIRLHVTNNGPPVEISQVHVDEANWQFDVDSPGRDAYLETGESATVDVPYHWMPGYDYEVALLTSDGVTFGTTVVAAQLTPGLTGEVLLTLAFVGFLVGIVPVTLGMFWFPFMQSMSRTWLHAVLAFSAGILAFLVFDAGFEAFEVADQVPSYYAGPLLVVLGIAGALLLVQAVMDWQSDDEEPSRLALAYSAALGIGLHNFAEGLAIGGAFAIGRASLGAFLIVGFMIHNVTEGPVFVAPLAEGERPPLWHFGALGLLAGAPAILGGWIGILTQSPTVIALFLAIGVGALLQVVFDIGDIVARSGSIRAAPNLAAFGVGLVVMYATDLLVVI
ncbi:ZIP family metal transporter [Haloarchaeobius sp. HRN-SO-5]|uniref:ZIP family metal transporter n=1 Tax=Haloarchaeobius sp. HRN-SO-5 TaxID=3446118 RepID=UPI003EB97523